MMPVQRNNARVPRCGYIAFAHFFAVISVVGIGAFTGASEYAPSTTTTNVIHHLSGGASTAAVSGVPTENSADKFNQTSTPPATFAATAQYNTLESTTSNPRPSVVTSELDATDCVATEQEAGAETATAVTTLEGNNMEEIKKQLEQKEIEKGGPLKVLFLSADTGGGHRASAESLAKQFLLHFPGSTYDLLDIWTMDGVYPYKTLVKSYKHLSAHPKQWKFLYHLSNTRPYEIVMDFHSSLMCERKIRKRMESYDPDVVVSVHPTMNNVPIIATKKISRKKGKHIPFFTVVTDLGSGHCTWFHKDVTKMYIASDRMRSLAKRRGRTPDESLVMSGLPIRHDFAVQAELMGDRTTSAGKTYQKTIRTELGIKNVDKQMILVMGGGEGVGNLSDIVNNLYKELTKQGVDATIYVVCGRNEQLKNDLDSRDWDKVLNGDLEEGSSSASKRQRLKKLFKRTHRSKEMEESLQRAADREEAGEPHPRGQVDVVGLGFVTKMAEYMVAADVLVSKAGPGTIAEAAAVGLPVMLTSFLPGQEAGNVDVVLDAGFGDYNDQPEGIAAEVACWLQDEKLLVTMSHATQEVSHPHAAQDIVLDIGSITHAWMQLNRVTSAKSLSP